MLKAPAQDAGVIGEEFPSRCMALLSGPAGYASVSGTFRVRRGTGLAARVVAVLIRLPKPGEAVPVSLVVDRWRGYERWTRRFAGRRIVSLHQRRGDLFVERIGALRMFYEVEHGDGVLAFKSTRAALGVGRLEIRLPRALTPIVNAAELESGDALRVSVTVRMPWFGAILAYDGFVSGDVR